MFEQFKMDLQCACLMVSPMLRARSDLCVEAIGGKLSAEHAEPAKIRSCIQKPSKLLVLQKIVEDVQNVPLCFVAAILKLNCKAG